MPVLLCRIHPKHPPSLCLVLYWALGNSVVTASLFSALQEPTIDWKLTNSYTDTSVLKRFFSNV